jgi:hypothetical protein
MVNPLEISFGLNHADHEDHADHYGLGGNECGS